MLESVSCEVRECLEEYKQLLLKWNEKINLIGSSTANDIDNRHFLDSLQLVQYIKNFDIEIIDFGSGAGLPGIVLSICGVRKVTLVESDTRKCAFLRQAAKLSSNEVRIINDRIENIDTINCDIITSRAFSELSNIFDLASRFEVKDKFLLHKGLSYQKEIGKAQRDWLFNYEVHDSISSCEGKVLEIKNLKKNNER